jgi:hypothetical protein
MSYSIDGVTMDSLTIDGVAMDTLTVDGALVWESFLPLAENFTRATSVGPSTGSIRNAGWAFDADGDVRNQNTNASLIDNGNYSTPRTGGIGANFEMKVEYVSGDTLFTGTVGSYVTLSSDTIWGLTTTLSAAKSANYSYIIREILKPANSIAGTLLFSIPAK